MKLLNDFSIVCIQNEQLASATRENFHDGDLASIRWDIWCEIFGSMRYGLLLPAVYIENFYHTEIFPAPPGIRFIRCIYNFPVAIAVLFIEGDSFSTQMVLTRSARYVKSRSLAVSGFQIQQWIASKLVREKIIRDEVFLDRRDILDTSFCPLIDLLLRRNHFITCNSAQLFVVIKSIIAERFITNTWISPYRLLKRIEQSPECAGVLRDLAPKI